MPWITERIVKIHDEHKSELQIIEMEIKQELEEQYKSNLHY